MALLQMAPIHQMVPPLKPTVPIQLTAPLTVRMQQMVQAISPMRLTQRMELIAPIVLTALMELSALDVLTAAMELIAPIALTAPKITLITHVDLVGTSIYTFKCATTAFPTARAVLTNKIALSAHLINTQSVKASVLINARPFQ